MSETRLDRLKKIEQLSAIAVAIATVWLYTQQAREQSNDVPISRAAALRGATEFYGRTAAWFGRQALRTEHAYWETVNSEHTT